MAYDLNKFEKNDYYKWITCNREDFFGQNNSGFPIIPEIKKVGDKVEFFIWATYQEQVKMSLLSLVKYLGIPNYRIKGLENEISFQLRGKYPEIEMKVILNMRDL